MSLCVWLSLEYKASVYFEDVEGYTFDTFLASHPSSKENTAVEIWVKGWIQERNMISLPLAKLPNTCDYEYYAHESPVCHQTPCFTRHENWMP